MPNMMENILMRKCNLPYKKAKKTVAQARLNLSMEKQNLLWSKELEVECFRMVDEERKLAAQALEEEFDRLRPTIIRHGEGEERISQRQRSRESEDTEKVPASPQTPKLERSRELSSTPSVKQRKRGKSVGRAPGRRIQLSPKKKSTLKIGSGGSTDDFPDINLHHSARSKPGPSLSSALMRKDASQRLLDESSQLTGSTNDTGSTGSSSNTGAKPNSRFCRSKREVDGRRRSYSPFKCRPSSCEGAKENIEYTNDESKAEKSRRSSLQKSSSRNSGSLSPAKKTKGKNDGDLEKQLKEFSEAFGESPTKKVKKKKKKKKKDKILGDSANDPINGGDEFQLLSESFRVVNTASPSKPASSKVERPATKKSPRRKSTKIIPATTANPTSNEEDAEIPQILLDATFGDTKPGRHSFAAFEKSKSSPSKTKGHSAHGREISETDNTSSLMQDSSRSLRSSASRQSTTRMVPVLRTSPRSPSRTRNTSRLNDSVRSCGSTASRKFKSRRRPSDLELSDTTFTLSPSKSAQEKYSSFFKGTPDSPESLLSLESFSASKSDAFGSFDSPSTSDTSRTLPCVPSLSPLGVTLSSTAPRQPKRQVSNMASAR